jgi:glycosyltransferase involved in cell wall biosynthesis
VSSRRPAHLIVLGHPATEVLEGGGSRIAQLRARLERLPASITYVDPEAVTSARIFVRYAVRSGLAAKLLDPLRRHFVISVGYAAAPSVLALLRRRCPLLYFDVHDEPRRQYRDLRIVPHEGEDVEGKSRLLEASVAAFETVGFASPGLAGFFPPRDGVLIAPNSADPAHFEPSALPQGDTVALVGSTTKGRGADLLIEACAIARRELPGLTVRLALNDTGGRGNLGDLRREHGQSRWISFETVGYAQLPAFLQGAAVCVLPHPRTEYTDIALSLKLFDYMASGRPVLTTDCPAAAEVVTASEAGAVCTADPSDMARALLALLTDRELASWLGQNGRRAVETTHNWDRAFEAPLGAISRQVEGAVR